MRKGTLERMSLSWLVASAVALAGSSARATDMAAAEALFREARDLMAAGKTAQACQKFAESERLDPSPGTLLNLARCHAQQGKTASAWAEFLAAKRTSEAARRSDLAQEAQRQADALVGQLSYLTISVSGKVEGLVVTRNAETLAPSALGSRLPVDPGRYTVRASAPGYTDWSGEVSVEGGAASESLVIPPLKPAPVDAPPAASVPPDRASTPPAAAKSRPPVLGYVVGGVGIVATGVGLTFGALASSKYGDAEDACPTFHDCSPSAMDARKTAGTFATISTVGVSAGLAAVAAGVVLILTHRSTSPAAAHARLVPAVGPGVAGGVLEGAF